MTALRTALVGYGLGGRVIHRPLLQAVEGVRLTHVVTSDPQRRQQAAVDAPEAALVSSADELWGRADEYDAVVVVTGNEAHVPLATTAMDLGKAVVVDKPLAVTADDAARLVAHARETGAVLSVFHNRRWDSDTLTARRLLDEGTLGDVHRLESRFTRFRPTVVDRWRERPGGGGVLLDLGTHLVDQAVHLLGPVDTVWADVAVRRTGAVVDDDCLLVLTHAARATSMLWCSAAAPWTGPRLVLQGSRAGWVKQDLDGQEAAQREGVAAPDEPDGALWDEHGARPVPSARGDWGAYYRSFAAAVRDGGPVPVDPADAVAVLRVLEAAQQSSRTRRVVAVG
ncbi:MAG TPA: Gfo/Idh/MocA family oxidoreductase [Mycobacteriales bacterium]|nr:Gfo/Idh/MocA family oxidoreductase [Mycobacteriales bacterium]